MIRREDRKSFMKYKRYPEAAGGRKGVQPMASGTGERLAAKVDGPVGRTVF